MLFTPSPPLFSQSVSSSVENNSSPTHTASIFHARNIENQLPTNSFSDNATLITNGLSNDQLLSTSQIYHTEDKSPLSNANLWSNNTIMPVANPLAAAALVGNNEILINEEPVTKSATPSPLDTRKNSERIDESSTICSTNLYPFNRKVILNVGGVRHESNLFFFHRKKTLVSVYHSFMAYTFSSSKYTSRSFG